MTTRLNSMHDFCHTMIVIGHDFLLYEDATGLIDPANQAMSDAANEAAVILYLRECLFLEIGPKCRPSVLLR